jgi:hypothetical protein
MMTLRTLPALVRHSAILALVFGGVACSDDSVPPRADTRDTSSADVEPDIPEAQDVPTGHDTTPSEEDGTVEPGEDVTDSELIVTEVIPGKGLTIGLEQVEIVGDGFFQGLQVFFGESLAQDIFVLNSKRLIVLTPPRGPGLVDVRVVDPETGESSLLEAGFLYFNPISIVSVEPPVGHVLGGERVTVRGAGFRDDSALLFGHKSALQVQVLDDQTISAIVPDGGEGGAVDVHVSNDQGVGTLDDGFLYVDVPRIESVVAAAGPVEGGNAVELRGKSFYEPLVVLFGGKPLINAKRVSETRITGVVPEGLSQGPVDVIVSTPYGTGARPSGYTYLLDPNPGTTLELLAVSPATGSARGGELVTLIAKGLGTSTDTTVTIGGVSASILSVDAAAHVAIVEAPPGSGTVDVSISRAGQRSALNDAYTFLPVFSVSGISPASGPVAGGTSVEITGEGFLPGLELRIGALSAASVRVVSPTLIRATTPPGAPGLADIIVLQSGQVARLEDGFSYDAEYRLWLVDPAQGSQAGGTEVMLVGSGFPTDAKVKFGNSNATHVEVLSPTLITCKSPPGELGTVPVRVSSVTKGELVVSDAFTYYDPTSVYGGTWGGQIENDVNVTVLDGGTGGPVADAFVMLWTDPRTPYQGFTNIDGQVTFSGADLKGEQMVSASKPGYSRASVVEYDATNVTLYLNPTTPPSPGGPPPPLPPAIIRGRITNLDKAFPVPFGRCPNKPNAAGRLCDFCQVDTDCGAGYRCSDLPDQFATGESGRFCTQDCTSNAQCPSDFMCVPLVAGEPQQCAPKSGEITAFCDITNAHIFDNDWLPDPGVQVDSNDNFEINPVPDRRLGEIAVFCNAGVIDLTYGIFTPLMMGVARHVIVYPGDEVDLEIALTHPLSRTQRVELDPVPRGTEGPDFDYIFPFIELGSDGTIFLPPQAKFGEEPFILENFPTGLTGDLYDASFTFLAGSFSFSDTNLPYTLTLHQNITRLDEDTMFYLDDASTNAWGPQRSGVSQNVNGLFWAGTDLIGVGSDGLVVRSLGRSWARQESRVFEDLRAVHGVPGGVAVAVGDAGAITRYDGFRWAKMDSPSAGDLRAVWLQSATEGWAVGAYNTLRLQNGTWTSTFGNASRNLYGVYGFAANDVWAVGASGTILRYDGLNWNLVNSGTNLGLRAVWGAAPDDVWMVGEGGIVLHWDGSSITKVSVDTTQTLTAIWGRNASEMVIVGGRGTAFAWDGASFSKIALGAAARDTDLLAVSGPPSGEGTAVMTGAHELILGPILAVPEKLNPGSGGIMGDDYRISWQSQPGPDPHFSYVEVAIPTMFGPVPEWTMINDYDVQSILLPDFPNIEGTPGIDPGTKILTIFRVYKEGFDIDSYSNIDINQFGWRSWSVHSIVFAKL